ncbi:MAG TPA: Ig domain-containing protein [Solirubrobacteraceae bacterium]|jgi:hypothetical protein
MLRRHLLLVVVLLSLAASVAVAAGGATPAPVWSAGTKLPLPADAATAPGEQDAGLFGLWCSSVGNCDGVGSFYDTNGATDSLALTARETDGVWSAADVSLPPGWDTQAGGQHAALNLIDCSDEGDCTAVGGYSDTLGHAQPMAIGEVSGAWKAATEITLPSGADPTDAGIFADALEGVSCTSAGNCVAVGSYDAGSGGISAAMYAIETAGVWAPAVEVTLPSDALPPTNQDAYLYGVKCTSAGNCLAVGGYFADVSNSPTSKAMTLEERGGVWGAAQGLPLPAGGGDYPSAGLQAVDCPSQDNCVATGDYPDATDNVLPVAATETDGSWSAVTQLSLPANARTTYQQYAQLYDLTCTSLTNCVAGGFYDDDDVDEDSQAMSTTEVDGIWQRGVEVTLPANATTVDGGQNAGVGQISCPGAQRCEAGGWYNDSSGAGDGQAMFISSLPSLSISTASLPSGVAGSAYAAQLQASGGSGAHTWSLGSGALPAGLSLDPATGAISGTPTTAGSASFTVVASDPGPPLQLASAPLSITVAAGPVVPQTAGAGPGVSQPVAVEARAGVATIKISGDRIAAIVSCAPAGGRCAGTVVVSVLERRRGQRVVSVTAAAGAGHVKLLTVTIARHGYSVAGGGRATVTLRLNARGRALLAKHPSLHARLALAPAAGTLAAGPRTIAFTKPRG